MAVYFDWVVVRHLRSNDPRLFSGIVAGPIAEKWLAFCIAYCCRAVSQRWPDFGADFTDFDSNAGMGLERYPAGGRGLYFVSGI